MWETGIMERMLIILAIVGAECIGCAHNTAQSGAASTRLDPQMVERRTTQL